MYELHTLSKAAEGVTAKLSYKWSEPMFVYWLFIIFLYCIILRLANVKGGECVTCVVVANADNRSARVGVCSVRAGQTRKEGINLSNLDESTPLRMASLASESPSTAAAHTSWDLLTEVTKEQEILDNQNPTDQDQMFFFPELSNEITSVCKSREIGNKVNNSDITNDAVQVTSDKNLVVYSGCKTNTKNNQSDDIWVDSLHVPSSDVRQTQSNLYNGDIEETHNVTPSLLAVEDTLLTCSKYESLSKEYLYLDEEKGVALLERSLPVKSVSEHQEACLSAGHHSNDSLSSITSSVPASFVYDSDVLYEELERRGLNPGPITRTTKKVYLRKLYHHQKHNTVAPTIANTTRDNDSWFVSFSWRKGGVNKRMKLSQRSNRQEGEIKSLEYLPHRLNLQSSHWCKFNQGEEGELQRWSDEDRNLEEARRTATKDGGATSDQFLDTNTLLN
uniref:LEM domain-containing protein n=1 Tax=Timema monikensis TaxID=170555 RepID=A0A7R9EB76_9NEOP|nr:unnamed protein product [Timema monikensis]